MCPSANSNTCVSSEVSFHWSSILLIVGHVFQFLLVPDNLQLLDVVNFASLVARYFCIPINIPEQLYFGMQSSYLETV